MFIVVGKKARRAIAIVDDFETGALQAVDESCGAERGRSFLGAGLKGGGAGGRADQGNLLRLTDDFDRQSLAPCVVFPSAAAGLRLTSCSCLFAARAIQTTPGSRNSLEACRQDGLVEDQPLHRGHCAGLKPGAYTCSR